MSLLGGFFGKPPELSHPTQTANTQFDYNTKAGNQSLVNTAGANQKSTPFGSSTVQFDPQTGLPMGYNTQFDPSLQGGVDNLTGAFGAQTGNLPGGIDFSGIDTSGILNAGMNAYDAYANPQIDRQLNQVKTTMGERGIPLGQEISDNAYGDVYDAANRARTSFFGDLYGRMPGMKATETGTLTAQGMAQGQLAGQNVGLMQGLYGLTPQTPQLQAQYGSPDFMGAVNANDAQKQKAYETKQQGLGNLLKFGTSLAFAPMTGGMSLAGLGGLFNNGSMGAAG